MNRWDVEREAGRAVQELRADSVLVIAVRGDEVIAAVGGSGDPPGSAWLERLAPSLVALVDGYRQVVASPRRVRAAEELGRLRDARRD